MRKTLTASALALLGLVAAAPVQAMPFPPLSGGQSGVTLAAYGCGPGWTRGPYGRCHPMGYAARPVYGYHPYRPYHPYYAHPYHRNCWWRAGVRVCN
jgi:hypothetical protein